jgi:DNA mismatch repair protein MutS2
VDELTILPHKIKKSAKTKNIDIRVEKSDRAPLSIKLLGLRADEAIDELDMFLSNALVHGLNEIEIIHGTGTGILAKTISEYLKKHPKVKNFYRMPGNMGVTVAEL